MPKTKKSPSLKLLYIISGILLTISIIIFVILGFSVQYQDLDDTYSLAEETTAFLEAECQKYDNYTQGISARSKQDLLDTANELKTFISPSNLTDSNFLHEYIHTVHVSGIVVVDQNLSLIAQSDMDDQDSYSLWSDIIKKDGIKNILEYPDKTYIDHISLKRTPYDYAVVADDDESRLILCYTRTEKPASDPYELTIKSALTNNNFHKNPVLAITDGYQILSTNNSTLDKLEDDQYQELNASIHWKDNQLTKFKYQDVTWYGLRRVYSNYYVYAVYPSNEVFSNRTNYIIIALMAYLGLCVILLVIQRHFDKMSLRKTEKQLRIINAISTSYSSTFLLHIDTMELEPVKISERLEQIYKMHPKSYDFLFSICKNEVASEYHPTVMHFLELDTIADRLKGHPFLESEVKDCNGSWYSITLIPQKCDESGNIQALLIATRDVTTLKQTEELSFKDKLTGLHNRNYMESRIHHFVRSGDLPVSLIMADCNYLKRTNDTLGHEYGDLLLQRIANVIKETIPPTCIAMRVGGDEFLILCTQCTNEKAHQLIHDIREKLKERSDDTLTLSVSFGVSTTESGIFSFEEAYETADQEMYKDKQASRIER